MIYVIISVLAGFACGVLSGFGIGGGTLLMIYMLHFADIPQHTAQGINLLYFIPTSLSAIFSHINNKLVEYKTAIPAIISGSLTTALSSLLAAAVDTEILRKTFGVFLIYVGAKEVFRKKHQKKK